MSSTVSRTNLVTNPSFETGTTNWAINAVGDTIAQTATYKLVGSNGLLVTQAAVLYSGTVNSGNLIPVTVGQTYTASAYIYVPSGTAKLAIGGHQLDSALNVITQNWSNNTVDTIIAAGTWTRLSVTFTITTGVTQFRLYIVSISTTATAGQQFVVDAVLFENNPALSDYFDGTNSILTHTYSGTPTLAWSGTANASTSTMTGVSDYTGPYGGKVTGLTAGTAYTYTVTETNAITTGLSSAASSSVTSTTLAQSPTVGTATATGLTTATVGYTGNATGGSAITTYTATSSPGNITGTGTTSPITVSGLTTNTSYTFTVTATNGNGISLPSAASNSITTPVVPAQPVVTGADLAGSGGAFYWSVAYGTPTVSYIFTIYSPPDAYSAVTTVYSTFATPSTVTTFSVTGSYFIRVGTYQIVIYAQNSYGTSATTTFNQYMS